MKYIAGYTDPVDRELRSKKLRELRAAFIATHNIAAMKNFIDLKLVNFSPESRAQVKKMACRGIVTSTEIRKKFSNVNSQRKIYRIFKSLGWSNIPSRGGHNHRAYWIDTGKDD